MDGAVPLPVPSTVDITAPGSLAPDLPPATGPPGPPWTVPGAPAPDIPAPPAPLPGAPGEAVTAGPADDAGPAATAATAATAASNGGPAALATPSNDADPSAPASAPATADGTRRARRRHSRRHRGVWWAVASTVVVLVLVAAGLVGAHRINRPLATPVVTPGLPLSVVVPGASPALPWPSTGQGAVSVPALGFAAQSRPESAVPIASLTKMTNALVVLRDHPVAPGATGPPITVTAGDVAEYDSEVHNDESSIPIQVGEVLTERQMLEAMLTQSANDIAYSLAVWDSGSIPAFVAKMNAVAGTVGTTATHYVDDSGYDPGSVSTAADCLRIAAAAMAIPTFAEVVGMSSVALPLVGTVPNIVTEIGSNGVVGIKSGYTSQAKGCMVLAASRTVGGQPVLVLAAVLTQPVPPPVVPTTTTTRPPPTTTSPVKPPTGPTTPTAPTTTTPRPPPTTTTTVPLNDLVVPDPLRYTRPAIEALLRAAEGAVVPVTVTTAGRTAAVVTAEWGGVSHRAAVVTADGASLAAWPGQQVKGVTRLAPVPAGGRTGRPVGEAVYTLGSQMVRVPLRLSRTVSEPSWWWRLVHD